MSDVIYDRSFIFDFVFKDLAQKPQYPLILQTQSATLLYLKRADPETMPNEALIWKRVRNDSRTYVKNYGLAEDELLKNPNAVFYGSLTEVKESFQHYPCHIESTSKVMLKVWLLFTVINCNYM